MSSLVSLDVLLHDLKNRAIALARAGGIQGIHELAHDTVQACDDIETVSRWLGAANEVSEQMAALLVERFAELRDTASATNRSPDGGVAKLEIALISQYEDPLTLLPSNVLFIGAVGGRLPLLRRSIQQVARLLVAANPPSVFAIEQSADRKVLLAIREDVRFLVPLRLPRTRPGRWWLVV